MIFVMCYDVPKKITEYHGFWSFSSKWKFLVQILVYNIKLSISPFFKNDYFYVILE